MIGRFPGVVGGLAALASRLLARTDTAASKWRRQGDDSGGKISNIQLPNAGRVEWWYSGA